MIKVDETFDINYIDASCLSCFVRCPAKYLFERLMGLRQPDAPSIAPDYGTDMHRALPFCYEGSDDCHPAVTEFQRAWDARDYGEDDEKRSTLHAAASITDFAMKHAPDVCPYKILKYPISVKTYDVVSPNEVPFLIDIGGPLPAAGRIDAAVRWNADGSLWALDYKTSREISARYFKNFESSPQACFYTLALSQIANERATGLIIEAIRVSKSNVENQLNFTFIQDCEIESLIRLANRKATEMLELNKMKIWPKQLTSCGPYSMFEGQPGRMCQYHSICTDPDWESAAKYYCKTKPFHPFHIR